MPSSRYTVSDVMTHTALAIGRDASYKEIVALMDEGKVSALPVLEGEGRVIGVVDEEVEAEIRRTVLGGSAALTELDVAVVEDVATLRGALLDRALVPLLARAVRAVEGVVDVRMDLDGQSS